MSLITTLIAAAVYAAVVMRPFIAAGLRRRGFLLMIDAAPAAPGGSVAAPVR
jgi:hypothetical protein